MTGSPSPAAPAPQPSVLPILWAALVASVFIYGGVLFVVTGSAAAAGTPAPEPVLLYALAGSAVVTASASIFLPRMLLAQAVRRTPRPTPGAPRPAGDPAWGAYVTSFILGMALAESVAVFGFVLGFLRFPPAEVVPFFAVSLGLMLTRFPGTERVREELENARRG